MKRSFGSMILLYGMGLLLLAFTSYRTVSLVAATLPAEAQILSVVAVVAFDLGIVAWAYYFGHGAKSNEQVTISGVMVTMDFVGMAILFIAHTLINQHFYAPSSNMLIAMGTTAVWTLVIGTLGNVAGLLACHLLDPDEIMRRAQRDAEAEIDHEAVEIVRRQSKQLASRVAPSIAQEALEKARAGRASNIGLPRTHVEMAFPKDVATLQAPPIGRQSQVADETLEDVSTLRMPPVSAQAVVSNVVRGKPGRPPKHQPVEFSGDGHGEGGPDPKSQMP